MPRGPSPPARAQQGMEDREVSARRRTWPLSAAIAPYCTHCGDGT